MSSCVGSSSESNPKNMILLVSSDNERFEVEEAVVLVSQTIKNMIEDINCSDTPIPLPNVTSKVLSKVIEFCRRHHDADDTSDTDHLQEFDTEFLKVDQNMLFDLVLAANYLDIKSLLDTTCKCVADMMKGKTPEEIRKHFHIKNDYTPEEEAEVRQENAWAFE